MREPPILPPADLNAIHPICQHLAKERPQSVLDLSLQIADRFLPNANLTDGRRASLTILPVVAGYLLDLSLCFRKLLRFKRDCLPRMPSVVGRVDDSCAVGSLFFVFEQVIAPDGTLLSLVEVALHLISWQAIS